MKFTFDWEDVIRGKIEIDAKNGLEAESIFNQMSLSERQEKFSMLRDNDDTEITFVDFEWSDTLTYDEWKSDWGLTSDEWEEWKKRYNH